MKNIFIVILSLISLNAFAGNAATGNLSKIHFMSNGVILIYTDGTRSGTPSCAANQPQRFAIDGTSEAGKIQASGMLSMYAAGKKVIIYGTDSCNAYGDTETISFFRTDD